MKSLLKTKSASHKEAYLQVKRYLESPMASATHKISTIEKKINGSDILLNSNGPLGALWSL